ncbi:MAG: MoxR family ATPase [bacterium]|nr:MoxR family ATPase [bacterium]
MTLQAPREAASDRLQAIIDNVERVILGKREAVTLAVTALLAEGHLLLEDVPGTGKTTLARALARSVDVGFQRIQFTSDLLPADVLGLSTQDPRTGEFQFRPGPVFSNVLLADELNRTPPRTQSALLECMNERAVTVEGETRELERPFFVVATQNPLEFEGTYALPESQLDRFLMRLRLGYPDVETERAVLTAQVEAHPIESLEPVVSSAELLELMAAVRSVDVDARILDYLLDVVGASRAPDAFLLGASPRASLGLFRATQALALIDGRDYCVPDDVKRLAAPVLAHRIVPHQRSAAGLGSDELASELLMERIESLTVPD